MSTLEAGTSFGSYIIEGFIAGGGMGEVYAARHSVYGTAVAMKVLHPDLHADPAWRRRFDIEGLVGTQLKHPHVLSARELVEHDGRVALVIDLVRGGQTLLKVVTREFPTGLPLTSALQVFLGIVQGVEYAHTKNIVHGDIKPENVLLAIDYGPDKGGSAHVPATWVPLVTDFGTVALIAEPVMIEGQVAVVASPRYATPEHMYGVDHLERRSDLYALGLLLHFLLTGHHVSDARTVREAAELVARPIPLTLLVDQPDSIIALIKKACALKPDDRFSSCRELALAIRRTLDELGVKLVLEDLQAELATEVMEERANMGRGRGTQDTTGLSSQPTEPVEPPVPPEERMKDSPPQGQPAHPSAGHAAHEDQPKNPLWGGVNPDEADDEDAPTARLTPDRIAGLFNESATPEPAGDRAAPPTGELETAPPASERNASPPPAGGRTVGAAPRTDVVTIPEFEAPSSIGQTPPASQRPTMPDIPPAHDPSVPANTRPSQVNTTPGMKVPSIADEPTAHNPRGQTPPPVPSAGGIPAIAWFVGGVAVTLILVALFYSLHG